MKPTELGVGLVRDKAEGILFLGWSFGFWNPTILGKQGRAKEARKLVAWCLSQQLRVHIDHWQAFSCAAEAHSLGSGCLAP